MSLIYFKKSASISIPVTSIYFSSSSCSIRGCVYNNKSFSTFYRLQAFVWEHMTMFTSTFSSTWKRLGPMVCLPLLFGVSGVTGQSVAVILLCSDGPTQQRVKSSTGSRDLPCAIGQIQCSRKRYDNIERMQLIDCICIALFWPVATQSTLYCLVQISITTGFTLVQLKLNYSWKTISMFQNASTQQKMKKTSHGGPN